MRCVSCGREAISYVRFQCPDCGAEIVRCQHCRKTKVKWTCPSCGLEGP